MRSVHFVPVAPDIRDAPSRPPWNTGLHDPALPGWRQIDFGNSYSVEFVKGIAWNEDLKIKSFFVRAPNCLLIEIVEADPLPYPSWLNHVHSEHDSER
jgi:hypothetical protein